MVPDQITHEIVVDAPVDRVWAIITEAAHIQAWLVELTLAAEGTATRLRVVESGFQDLDLPEAEQARWAADNTQGWQGGFDALRQHARRVAA